MNQQCGQSVCLNKWDVQSKHIQPEDGKANALYSGECRYGGGESYVMQSACIGNGQAHQLAMDSVVGALNCMHDQQAVITGIHGDTAGTLDSSYHKGCGERNGTEREVVFSLDRASFNQGKNALYDFAVEEELAQPVVARGPGGVLARQSERCAQETTKVSESSTSPKEK